MFAFFEGPEPSDGLRMKKFSLISSTDWDMIIGGKQHVKRVKWLKQNNSACVASPHSPLIETTAAGSRASGNAVLTINHYVYRTKFTNNRSNSVRVCRRYSSVQ